MIRIQLNLRKVHCRLVELAQMHHDNLVQLLEMGLSRVIREVRAMASEESAWVEQHLTRLERDQTPMTVHYLQDVECQALRTVRALVTFLHSEEYEQLMDPERIIREIVTLDPGCLPDREICLEVTGHDLAVGDDTFCGTIHAPVDLEERLINAMIRWQKLYRDVLKASAGLTMQHKIVISLGEILPGLHAAIARIGIRDIAEHLGCTSVRTF